MCVIKQLQGSGTKFIIRDVFDNDVLLGASSGARDWDATAGSVWEWDGRCKITVARQRLNVQVGYNKKLTSFLLSKDNISNPNTIFRKNLYRTNVTKQTIMAMVCF